MKTEMSDTISSEVNPNPNNLSKVDSTFISEKKNKVASEISNIKNRLNPEILAARAREIAAKGNFPQPQVSSLEEINIPVQKEPETVKNIAVKPEVTQSDINYLQTNPVPGTSKSEVQQSRFMIINSIANFARNIFDAEARRQAAETKRLKRETGLHIALKEMPKAYINTVGGLKEPHEVIAEEERRKITQETKQIITSSTKIGGTQPLGEAARKEDKTSIKSNS